MQVCLALLTSSSIFIFMEHLKRVLFTLCLILLEGWWQGCVQPRQYGAKPLLNRNGGVLNTLFWWHKCCNYGSWEGHALCSLYKYVFNTAKYARCYSLPLPSRIKENIPIERRDLWKLVPNYCDPTFASHFRMKRQTFQVKDNPLLPPRLCYDLYDLIIFIVSSRLIIIADHCFCAMIL